MPALECGAHGTKHEYSSMHCGNNQEYAGEVIILIPTRKLRIIVYGEV
jgi:hypothetical protein